MLSFVGLIFASYFLIKRKQISVAVMTIIVIISVLGAIQALQTAHETDMSIQRIPHILYRTTR